jgi:hypothetical protein
MSQAMKLKKLKPAFVMQTAETDENNQTKETPATEKSFAYKWPHWLAIKDCLCAGFRLIFSTLLPEYMLWDFADKSAVPAHSPWLILLRATLL